jgi:hypothetical protein
MFISCQEDESNEILSFNKIHIKKIKRVRLDLTEIYFYEYNDDDLISKVLYNNDAFATFDYNDQRSIINSSNYNSRKELVSYEIFEQDSNTISEIKYYLNSRNDWIIDYKVVYTYNSEGFCIKELTYQMSDSGTWTENHYYYTFIWSEGNLIEVNHYKSNQLLYSETLEYDNKYNPENLLSYHLHPSLKTINNPIKSIKKYQQSENKISTYSYKYNSYGYPTEKIILVDSVYYYVNYEYEIY